MSQSSFDPDAGATPASGGLDLGGTQWTPTQPANTYIGPLPAQNQADPPGYYPAEPVGQPGYGQSGAAPVAQPGYGQSGFAPMGYGQPGVAYQDPAAGAYPLYGAPAPTPVSGVYLPQPYAYPAVGPMMPGQLVQTAYGPMVVGQKSKLAAGLLSIFLGGFGVGQFYRGNVGMGVLQIIVFMFTLGCGWLWGLIEGIVTLASKPGAPYTLDSEGHLMI